GSGSPVERVLENTGERVVVFGRHEQNRVGRAHGLLELEDAGGRSATGPKVVVVEREVGDIEDLDQRRRRSELLSGTQRRTVARPVAQAAGDAEDLDG